MAEIAITGEPAGILWCEGIGCRIRGRSRGAAVTLAGVSLWGEILSMTPCCDECARSVYNRHPGYYRILPVSAYTDAYAAAREAMDATPGTVTAEVVSEPAAAPERPELAAGPLALMARWPAVAPEPPRQRYSRMGFAVDGEPYEGRLVGAAGTRVRAWAWALSLAASITLGVFLTRAGVHENATSWTYDNGEPGQPAIVWPTFRIIRPI